jgi:putative addiction module antidote
MAMTLKLTTVGNSVGVILPKELLEKLRVSKGDLLHVLEIPYGIQLQPLNQTLADQMDVAEAVMRRRRTLLSQLAK